MFFVFDTEINCTSCSGSGLVPSWVIWSSAAKKNLVKLQMPYKRAARLALNCTYRTNKQAGLSWLRVDERSTASLLVFMRILFFLDCPCLSVYQCLIHCHVLCFFVDPRRVAAASAKSIGGPNKTIYNINKPTRVLISDEEKVPKSHP